MSLKIRVITPDKIVWNTPAEEVILPSTTGQLGILSAHAPLITALEIGVLRVKLEDSWKPMVLLGGFAEVEAGDLAAAKSALEAASETLENAATDKEKIEASQNLKRVSARVQALTFL